MKSRGGLPEKIRCTLAGKLSGADAHSRMAPRPRPNEEQQMLSPNDLRIAAVLILLYQEENALFPLTLRPNYDGEHAGEVSLPGGEKERGDSSIIQTALRETHEEIGIAEDEITVLGTMTPLYIPTSRFLVTPVVGTIHDAPKFKIDPAEVAEIFEASLSTLMNTKHKEEIWKIDGERRVIPYYLIGGHKVWGATAMILSEFLDVVRSSMNRP